MKSKSVFFIAQVNMGKAVQLKNGQVDGHYLRPGPVC